MVRTMARPTSFGKDTGLQLRMTFTIFLLGLVYVVLIVALLAAGASGILVALIAGGLAIFQLFGSDKLALRAMGAREVTPAEAPELHAMIDRLCVQADLPKPKVAVADTRMPNAFALGRSPKNATVCATTGIMELLSPAELEGVMAHELTHVANRDVIVMTLAAFFATIAAYIVQFGFLFGGGMSDDDDNPSAMVLFLVSIAVYVVSFFLMQALSRYREYAADRGAALITGRPSALASALTRISSGMDRIPQKDLRAQTRARGVLHLPARRRQGDRQPLLDTSADGEADRGARAAGAPAAGRRRLMGLFDILTGRRKVKQPAESRLFAMSTAAVSLEMTLELKSSGKAAIVFQPLATADFSSIVSDMEEVLRGTGEDTGTGVERTDDDFGYRWMVLSDDEFEDLVVGINVVSQALQDGGYGERILCAVFAFRDAHDNPVYWIYNYKRGSYYPFVPAGGDQRRDSERELRLKAQIGHELPIEPELERWFPLWGIPI